jgi:ACS family sodium-dependent inorganic phosphate cotransporter
MALRIEQRADGPSSAPSSVASSRQQEAQQPQQPWQDWRLLVALCALSVVICYADRSNISTAILPMAEHFGWDKAFQGLVLSSFFLGYAGTQVLGGARRRWPLLLLVAPAAAGGPCCWRPLLLAAPAAAAHALPYRMSLSRAAPAAGAGARPACPPPPTPHLPPCAAGSLADKYGGKLVLASGVALWSLFTCLTPSAAASGTAALLAARVLLGVGEGVAFPSIHSLIARNVPTASQSTAVGVVTAASYAGTALAFGISPALISSYGWQAVFYGFGAMALVWLPLWLPIDPRGRAPAAPGERAPLLGAPGAAPGQGRSRGAGQASSYSTSAALEALRDGAGSPAAPAKPSKYSSEGLFSPTFWELLRAREVQAICATQYCQSWGMYGLLTWLPTFFSDHYGVQLADLGGYTLLPYVLQGGVGAAAGVLADRLIQGGWGVKSVRKWLQVVSMVGPAVCLLLAVSPLVGPTPEVASAIITVGLGLSALSLGGVSTSHLDVAPNNAGLVFGAGNTAATLAGLVSVPATGLLLQQTNSWPLVFGVTAAHYLVGSAVWAAWLGDRQLPADKVAAGAAVKG